MGGSQGIMHTLGVHSIGMLRGTIMQPLRQLVCGLKQDGEVMKKNIPLKGNLEDNMTNHTLSRIMRWIISVILQGLVDLALVIVMIMTLMIMTIDIAEMIVVKGIMTMGGVVMILIMIEVRGMEAGGGVIRATENVIGETSVVRGIQAHIEGMIVHAPDPDLVVTMIALCLGLLEVVAMVVVIVRIVMIGMIGLRGIEIVKKNGMIIML